MMKTIVLLAGVVALALAQPSSSLIDDYGAPHIVKHHVNQDIVKRAKNTVEAAASAMRREVDPSSLTQSQFKLALEGEAIAGLEEQKEKDELQKRLKASEDKSTYLEDQVAQMEQALSSTQGRLALLERKVQEASDIASAPVRPAKRTVPKTEDGESFLEAVEEDGKVNHPPWPFKLSAGDNKKLVLKGFNLHIESAGSSRGNLIIGQRHTYTEASNSLVVGVGNTIKGDGSVALGGTGALAEKGSVTLGGNGAQATGAKSVVVGGTNNGATGAASVVIGGASNEASVQNSGVYGGSTQTADSSNMYQYKMPAAVVHQHHHQHHHHHGDENEEDEEEYGDSSS